MKIRSGFVSNSSSSSFILGYNGEPLNKEQTIEYLKDKSHKSTSLLVIGRELGDGDDIFYLDSEKCEFILGHEDRFLNSGASWKAYPSVYKFDYEDWDFNDEDSSIPDVKKTGKGTEIRVYKDYNSDSENDFESFVASYFLTDDEFDAYRDAYWYDRYPRLQGMIAYKDKTTDPNIPEDWENVYIGINEFASTYGVALFTSKKLTEGDLKRLRSGKVNVKDGVCFYNDFIAVKKSDKTATFKDGVYSIVITETFFDKINSLKYFLKNCEEEE